MKHGKSWKDIVDGYHLNLAYFSIIITLVSDEKSGVDTDHIGSWDDWFKPELLQAYQNTLSLSWELEVKSVPQMNSLSH